MRGMRSALPKRNTTAFRVQESNEPYRRGNQAKNESHNRGFKLDGRDVQRAATKIDIVRGQHGQRSQRESESSVEHSKITSVEAQTCDTARGLAFVSQKAAEEALAQVSPAGGQVVGGKSRSHGSLSLPPSSCPTLRSFILPCFSGLCTPFAMNSRFSRNGTTNAPRANSSTVCQKCLQTGSSSCRHAVSYAFLAHSERYLIPRGVSRTLHL